MSGKQAGQRNSEASRWLPAFDAPTKRDLDSMPAVNSDGYFGQQGQSNYHEIHHRGHHEDHMPSPSSRLEDVGNRNKEGRSPLRFFNGSVLTLARWR